MKLVLSYHTNILVKKVIETEIENLGIAYTFNSGQIEILNDIDKTTYEKLKLNFQEYGITIQENQQEQIIQRIKDVIDDLIFVEENYKYNASKYISDKLNLSYGYVSNLFSEITLITLQFYIIFKRIERAKSMILCGDYNLTEVAHILNYSSVAHLSGQFKRITGLTASGFVKIISRRNYLISQI